MGDTVSACLQLGQSDMGLLQAERPYQGKIKGILRHVLKPEEPGTPKHQEQKEHLEKNLAYLC